MTWWRKVDTGELDIADNGWIKIKSIFRMINPATASGGELSNSDRGWIRIRSIWRKVDTGEFSIGTIGDGSNGNDKWIKVFSYGFPSPKTDGPKFYFIESPYQSSSNKSETAASPGYADNSSAWQNSKLYITRGKWQEDPIYFEITFQKSINNGLSWTTLDLPGIADVITKTYTSYSDSDFSDIFPVSSSNWYLITLSDVQNGTYYRVKIRAADRTGASEEELNSALYYFPTAEGVAPRLKFAFDPYAPDYDTNITGIRENESLSDHPNRKLAIEWKYNTSLVPTAQNTNSYQHQIVFMEDLNGNRVFGPVDVAATNTATQSYVINYPDNLTQEYYQVNVVTVAKDAYWSANGLDNHIDSQTETTRIASFLWAVPVVVSDPTVTISNRTKSGFDINWYSNNADRYQIEVTNASDVALPGFPKITTDTSQVLFGLTENTQYKVYVTALKGTNNQNKSNKIYKCVRTLTTGITPILGSPYDQTANSFKVNIDNYAFIDAQGGWNIQVNATNGTASRSQQVILVSNVTTGVPSCVTVSAMKINDTDLCQQSWEQATSGQRCETIGTFYCVKTGPNDFCTTFTSNYNATGSADGFTTQCYVNQACCISTTYSAWSGWSYTAFSDWGNCTQCQKARTRTATRTRTKTVINLDCSQIITPESETKTFTTPGSISGEACTDCIEYENCCCTAGCTYTNKTYTGLVTIDNCIDGDRARKTWWTATETCINTACTVISQQTVTKFDVDYVPCCTATCTTGTKTYGAWSAWSNCIQGERSRYRPWTATQTCTDTSCNVTTTEVSGNDFEYANCCTPSCTTGTKTYGAWSAWSNCINGERSRYRPWTATQTCTDSSCNVTTTEVSGNDFEYANCCTPSCTTGTKTYGAWSAWSNCINGERSRYRPWTAPQTCTDSSCNVTTTEVSGNDFEYANCCTASCTTGTKTYGAWSEWSNCIQGERSRYRSWTATQTCTDTSCNVTTSEVTGNEFEYTACCTASTTCTTGTRTYSAWSDWSTCRQGEQGRTRTWSEVTTCTTTDTSCNVTTTNTTNTGSEAEYRNCTVSPFFPFFPPYFPFFPPFFPFFPFFPPYFPFFPPYFPFFPFFPPYFPFFPPFFPFFNPSKFR